MKKFVLLLICAALLLFLGGCGQKAEEPAPQEPEVTAAPAEEVSEPDFVALYAPVTELYAAAYASGDDLGQFAWDNGISEYIGYSAHVGYALKDLDNDGTPELILGGMGADDYSNGVMYALYTLSGDQPVKVCESRARLRYYLMEDGRIFCEGSGGAADTSCEFFTLSGGALSFREGYRTCNDSDSSGSTAYYSATPRADGEEVLGDYNVFESILSADELWELVDRFEAEAALPPLTQIA